MAANWTCKTCTYINDSIPALPACEVCGTQRVKPSHTSKPSPTSIYTIPDDDDPDIVDLTPAAPISPRARTNGKGKQVVEVIDLVDADDGEDADLQRALKASLEESVDGFADAVWEGEGGGGSSSSSSVPQGGKSSWAGNGVMGDLKRKRDVEDAAEAGPVNRPVVNGGASAEGSAGSAQASFSLNAMVDRVELERARLERAAKKVKVDSSGSVRSAVGNPAANAPTPSIANQPASTQSSSTAYSMRYPHGHIGMTQVDGPADPRYTRFEELVDRHHLQRGIFSAFQIDDQWLMAKVNRTTEKYIVRPYGMEILEPPPMQYHPGYNMYWVFPPRRRKYCCMHVKLLVLWYPGFLRVAVPSANLVNHDWVQLENVFWAQDFPLSPTPRPENATSQFALDLTNILTLLEIPSTITALLAHADFSLAAVNLVFSKPGTHAGDDLHSYGMLRLAHCVRELHIPHLSPSESTLTAATSSLGDTTLSWLTQMLRAACGKDPHRHTSHEDEDTALTHVRILFPTKETVLSSTYGAPGAGTITFQRRYWEKHHYPQRCFRDSISTRQGVLSHAKMMVCLPATVAETGFKLPGTPQFASSTTTLQPPTQTAPIGWYYCGSHNTTLSAWGKLAPNRSGTAIDINNWELGVLVPVDADGVVVGGDGHGGGGLRAVWPYVMPAREYAGREPWGS